jgi:hypothetical protein
LEFTASVDGWVANATLEQRFLNNGILPLYVDFTRSRTTKFYAIFVGTLMWILSLSAFFISVSIWSRGRKVEPPTIAVAGALLFALPQLRNTQPGAPLLGCSADCASFFIAMFLVAISST